MSYRCEPCEECLKDLQRLTEIDDVNSIVNARFFEFEEALNKSVESAIERDVSYYDHVLKDPIAMSTFDESVRARAHLKNVEKARKAQYDAVEVRIAEARLFSAMRGNKSGV